MRLLFLTAISITLLSHAVEVAAEPVQIEARAENPLTRSREARAFTERHLQHLVGGPDCHRAVFVSYSVSNVARDYTDQWYDVSQIRSDLALASLDDALARCWASRGFTFLDRLWDGESAAGGFFPRSDLRGELISRPDKYADDNSLAGLAWVEAAQLAPDPLERDLMLARARATANFLINGGLWDETFGGGFWWNTRRGDTLEGKPAATNGLAAAFFLQLYGFTGEPEYREWSLRTLAWLDKKLFDPVGQLYRWSAHFQDLKRRRGEVVAERFFNYDQGIMVEANLLAYRYLGSPNYLERARQLGRRLEPVFWDSERGGYNLEAGIAQVYTVYSAWLSQSLLMLFEQDPDPYWLDRASANMNALNRTLWDGSSGGYNQRHYVCVDRRAPGCGGGAAWAVDSEKHTVAQAWMQRTQALLAATLQTQ